MLRRLTTDFLREFSDSFALDTADGQWEQAHPFGLAAAFNTSRN